MADQTPLDVRQKVIYSIFIRNFTEEGTFSAVIPELDRIKALGVDYIWFLPIYPIGELKRKGSLGSPYAIRDYLGINPEYGTEADFLTLVEECHARGLKVMLDIVFNHTSPDSDLAISHPEYFYRDEEGRPMNHAGDWSDVVDLDYREKSPLWSAQIDVLLHWAKIVDGFRCDVASLVNKEFWIEARSAVDKIRPDSLWLAESVHGSMKHYCHEHDIYSASDGELYRAFDITYDHDIFEMFQACVAGKVSLGEYLFELAMQEVDYPSNYSKLRFLENHDRRRGADRFGSGQLLRNWLAFIYFIPGTKLLYMGQEVGATKVPSLFEKDTVDWSGTIDLTEEIKRLNQMLSNPIFTTAHCHFGTYEDSIAVVEYRALDQIWYGFFQLRDAPDITEIDLAKVRKVSGGISYGITAEIPDGTYQDVLSDTSVAVEHNAISYDGKPLIIRIQ